MSPLDQVDQESLHSKIARIRKNLRELKSLGRLPCRKYLGNLVNTATAERFLQITIQAMLDIGSHIVAEEGLGEPLEYRDIFSLLAKAKVISRDLGEKLVELAGLRNRLVHLYEEIDHQMIHRFLKNDLKDIELFVKGVTVYLKKA